MIKYWIEGQKSGCKRGAWGDLETAIARAEELSLENSEFVVVNEVETTTTSKATVFVRKSVQNDQETNR